MLVLAIPLPLFFARTVYGVDGLKAWVAVGIVWTFFSAFTVVIYPLYESRTTLLAIFRGMVKVSDLSATIMRQDLKNVL